MNILVLTKTSIPEIHQTIPDWSSTPLSGYSYQVTEELAVHCSKPDAIIAMGVGVIDGAFKARDKWPDVPLFVYHWDCYSWVWDNPRPHEYDYTKWSELLKGAREVWVPSRAEQDRTRKWWNLASEIILSSCPYWEHDNVRDDGYALCALRRLPDPWCDEFDKACEELEIPYLRPNHDLSYEQYKDVVAGCRFIVSHYEEASTGGLSLLEAYYHGKPCLFPTFGGNAALDYFQDRNQANYPRDGCWTFSRGDKQSFRRTISIMYNATPIVQDNYRQWVQTHYSDRSMIRKMLTRVRHAILG